MTEIQGGLAKHLNEGYWVSWEIEFRCERRQNVKLEDGKFSSPLPVARQWFLKATVDKVMFDRLVRALEKVGVSSPYSATYHPKKNRPADFINIHRKAELGLDHVSFTLEAYDLRYLPVAALEKSFTENYFLEGEHG